MTKNEVLAAFREVASAEFANIPPEDEIDYEFSPRFERKMDKLFRKIDKNVHKPRISRRAIFAIASALILLLGCAIAAGAGWDSKVNIFTHSEPTYDLFTFKGPQLDRIEYEYKLTGIPEGFELTKELRHDTIIVQHYKNPTTEEEIEFSQQVANGEQVIDNEQGKTERKFFDGKTHYIYSCYTGGITIAFWAEDVYILEIHYLGDISEDDLRALIRSVE